MKTIRLIPVAVIAASCAFVSQAALAYSAGDTFVRGGFAKSDTRSDNGNVGDADLGISSGETGFTFGVGYLFTDNLGVELNSSEKIEHSLSADGGDAGTIDRMPVNLMVNYYPLGGFDSRVQPYAGAGLNYTRFSGEPEGSTHAAPTAPWARWVSTSLSPTTSCSTASPTTPTSTHASPAKASVLARPRWTR
ncbi:membrane protein [Halomonas sp. BC04]|nr:membrane protein [Halomonas sp. BC04]